MQDVKLIVLDVDGTLTDGVVDIGDDGTERKHFHIHDGLGIVMAQSAGLKIAVITGRTSGATLHRLGKLGVTEIIQGVSDKKSALQVLTETHHLQSSEVAYVGDDLNDLPAFEVAGVKIAVADAAAILRERADFVTERAGGRGAVRDAIDAILAAQGRYTEAVSEYLGYIAKQSDPAPQ